MMYCLAFDGGATHTSAGLYDGTGRLVAECAGEGCNPVEIGVMPASAVLARLGRRLLEECSGPAEACAGVSGAAGAPLQTALAQALCRSLPLHRAVVSTDLHPVLWANLDTEPGVLVIAGTGSSVLAQDQTGRLVKAGGRGVILGDEGSAYAVAASALRAAAHAVDGYGPPTALTDWLVKAAGVKDFEALPAWAAAAGKVRIAALAPVVVSAAEIGDSVARRSLEEQAQRLAAQAAVVYSRLEIGKNGRILLHGGLFEGGAFYRGLFAAAVRALGLPDPHMAVRRGHQAVAALAQRRALPEGAVSVMGGATHSDLPPTEQSGAFEQPLDALTPLEIVYAMNRADRAVADAVARQAANIAAAIEAAAKALESNGRLFYIGAGTSGRLGVIDASECPPTFGVDADSVVGLIAGGDRALRHSVETAEDDAAQGAADLEAAGLRAQDFVVGIAASGATPYVAGGLAAARRAGARTALLCCNPMAEMPADILIALETGPEALAGSTRLKAGTATKMALNMISTGAMAQSGRIFRGLMVGMKPTNAKLRRRAIRIVAALTGAEETRAAALLERAGDSIATAAVMHAGNLDRGAAEAVLRAAGGVLRRALENEVCTNAIDGAQ